MWEIIDNLKEAASLLVFFGCIMVLIGLVGGGIEIQKASIPKLSGWIRALCVIVGFGLIGISAINVEQRMVGEEATSAPLDENAPWQEYDTGYAHYRVCYVRADDPDKGLNVRELPGVTKAGRFHEVVGVIPYDARRVEYLGQRADVKGTPWYYVNHDTVVGWTSSTYLCPNAGECDC